MLRPGTRVERLTKKVGQRPATGKIIAVKGHAYEILWDDGHTTVTDSIGVIQVRNKKKD